MRELLSGLLCFIAASIVSCFQLTLGLVFSVIYSFYMPIVGRKPWYFPVTFWWHLIDGWCAAIGHLLYHGGYAQDLMWNVNGEILEDMITHEENTTFGQKNITVSASVGKLEKEGKLNKYGGFSSKVLNIAFGQKAHARDSWDYNQALKELQKGYFHKRKS